MVRKNAFFVLIYKITLRCSVIYWLTGAQNKYHFVLKIQNISQVGVQGKKPKVSCLKTRCCSDSLVFSLPSAWKMVLHLRLGHTWPRAKALHCNIYCLIEIIFIFCRVFFWKFSAPCPQFNYPSCKMPKGLLGQYFTATKSLDLLLTIHQEGLLLAGGENATCHQRRGGWDNHTPGSQGIMYSVQVIVRWDDPHKE